MKELAAFIELWIKKFVEFNLGFKLFYLSSVSAVTFLIDIIISYFDTGYPHEIIPYAFFLVFFLFWSFRIILSELRGESEEPLTPKDKRIFAASVFLLLTFLTIWFAQRELSFLPVLFSMLGFSFILWLVFLIMRKFVFERAGVHIYFGIITIITLTDVLLSYLIKNIFTA